MKELLEFIVKRLVDYPDEVKITEVIAEMTIIYEVKAAKSDTGKVLGRHGRHADAIRVLLRAATKGVHKHIQLEILEPDR